MYAEWSNKLKISNPSSKLMQWCKDNLRLPNPEYYKKQAMGKWTGNTPEFFDLYERIGSNIYLPFGCAREVYKGFGAEMSFKALHSPIRSVDYKSSINPYPYQERAIRAAQSLKNGIVVMPCGAGKTQTALEIIARVGGQALWLTHTQDLLNQSLNRAKSTLGIFSGNYGTITGGRVNIGQGITFATVQTMAKIDLAQYRDAWDIIIVDECHKAVGSPTKMMQFYKVLSSLSCRYKIGLTATPKRADGMEKSMFALLGGIIHEVSRDEVADTTCKVQVEIIPTGYVPNMEAVLAGDGTLNYSALIDDLIHDEARFTKVSDNIYNLCNFESTLVLANRVDYLERLANELKGRGKRVICLSGLGVSKAAKAARKEALRKLNDGEIDCVFATYQLAKEGLDIPNLRYVVFATPEKDSTTIMQAAGRVGRKSPGKSIGTVVDFVDNFGMFKGWAKKRNGYYKKLGYEILS